MSTLNVKKGDLVTVIAGSSKDKGRKGRVLTTSPKAGTVTVDGINMQKHHKKPKSAKAAGGITSVAGPVDVSNVMPVCQNGKCEKSGKGVRVRHVKDTDGRSVRVCYKCGEPFAKASVAKDKKAKETPVKETKAKAKETKAKDAVKETKEAKAMEAPAKETKETKAKEAPAKETKAKAKEAPAKETKAKAKEAPAADAEK